MGYREPNMLEIIESDRLKTEWENKSKTTTTFINLGTFIIPIEKPNDVFSETTKLDEWWWQLDSGELNNRIVEKMRAIDRVINNMWRRRNKSIK